MTLPKKPKLYSFWRSSAAFRVRIALNLKGIDYEIIPVHLTKGKGAQFSEEYSLKNPTHLVPLFDDGICQIHQSLAIIEYLDEVQAKPPLLPDGAADRAWVRSLAMDITSDIHPINNLRVLRYLVKEIGATNEAKDIWYQHWIRGKAREMACQAPGQFRRTQHSGRRRSIRRAGRGPEKEHPSSGE